MATFGNLETGVEPLAALMREHIEIHRLVTETREAVEQAVGVPGDTGLAIAALEQARDLDSYLARHLVIHISKEEDVLFPALRGIATDMDQVVDEMVEQHDEVRARRATIEQVLTALDRTHDEVDGARSLLSERLDIATSSLAPEALLELLDSIKRLDWILQGHFGDEEDDLFMPALNLLSAETFARLDIEARALER